MSTALVAVTTAATACVLATSFLVSPTFREDAILLLRKVYTTAGDFRQNRWNQFLDIVGDDPNKLWCYGSWTIFVTTYWLVGGIYTFFDITNKPDVLRRYKIQPGKNEPVKYTSLFKILSLVIFNQIIITVPLAWYLGNVMIWRGTPPLRDLPPFHVTLMHIAAFTLIEEVAFYYMHRLMHHKFFYKYIHKTHHEWTAPMSIVAIYANPIEHVINNILPVFLGVFILNSHISTAWLWFALAIAFTLSEHSGYHLPFFPSAEAHDFHHKTFKNCYGVLGILDWLHGTDVEFRKTVAFSRHRVLLGLDSARKLFPDPVAKKGSSSKRN